MLEPSSLVGVARELLSSWPYGLLATAAEGQPQARLTQHLLIEEDLTVWIGTSPRSRKVAAITACSGATYTVEDRSRFAYVTLSGRAEVVADWKSTTGLWIEDLRPFFPDGPGGGDFVLVRLKTEEVELMSFADGVHPDPYGLVPAVLQRSDTDRWCLADVEGR